MSHDDELKALQEKSEQLVYESQQLHRALEDIVGQLAELEGTIKHIKATQKGESDKSN